MNCFLQEFLEYLIFHQNISDFFRGHRFDLWECMCTWFCLYVRGFIMILQGWCYRHHATLFHMFIHWCPKFVHFVTIRTYQRFLECVIFQCVVIICNECRGVGLGLEYRNPMLLWLKMTLIVFFIPCYKHTSLTIVDCEKIYFLTSVYRDYHLFWYIMTI